jgi:putative ABC transport system substrate-binding protein
MMRGLLTGAVMGTALVCVPAWADQPSIPRVGVLIPPANAPLEEGLREGLRDLGYIEGRTILVEWRRSAGTAEELGALAAELARSKVDLIVASGSPAARAALTATTLPVVFAPVGDPVGTGFAPSLAHPGGNGTGVSTLSADLIPKRLEFLRMVVPRARRIAYLVNPSNPVGARQLEEAREAAQTLGVQLVPLGARNPGEIDAALRAISRSAVDGILVTADLMFLANKAKVARAVRKARLPAMVPNTEYRDDGILMSYGPNLKEVMRRAAFYVDKILKGAKPSELPIEQVSKVELVIDLRAARAMSLDLPQALLLRADEVIR